jgi:hypothetical protein
MRCSGIAPGFYVRAMAIFEVMLALTFPSVKGASGVREGSGGLIRPSKINGIF